MSLLTKYNWADMLLLHLLSEDYIIWRFYSILLNRGDGGPLQACPFLSDIILVQVSNKSIV